MLKFGTREIAISAVMAALVCATTLLMQIPIPATQGFFNVGDAMVMVAAITFGPIVGFFAGGLGSSLADLLGGWYVWVPFTLVIKGLEGFLAGSIVVLDDEDRGIKTMIVAWAIAGSEMVLGYFLVQYYMYGLGAALIELPFNVLQMVAGGIIGIPMSIALAQRMKL
ncbi:MAG: ECF transporter S component [Candidatus Bathyarchaeota archaeon]